MLILKTKFDFMTDLMSTNENYSYLCDVISHLRYATRTKTSDRPNWFPSMQL